MRIDANRITVRPVRRLDTNALARMHMDVLDDEFIVQYGLSFMRHYYEAFLSSDHAVALVAVDNETGEIVGGLLGTLRPHLHYRYMTRHFGVKLLLDLVFCSIRKPTLGATLVRTRFARYVSGVLRVLRARVKGRSDASDSAAGDVEVVGDLTHLFVSPSQQGRGVGRLLVARYEEYAAREGLSKMTLVTDPHGSASAFYDRLGWLQVETLTNRSGETFLLYEKRIQEPVSAL